MFRWKAQMLCLPEDCLKGLEALVRRGVYASRDEAIKAAIAQLLRKDLPVALDRLRSLRFKH
ncbi:MAG: transcriptional regulator [Thermoprotei archaeon]|nr:MAG: transcriptional regulator [Thermoprotei archaeon]